MTPIRLGVNVDHVATVRQARRGVQPDPVELALAAEEAGADSILAHRWPSWSMCPRARSFAICAKRA